MKREDYNQERLNIGVDDIVREFNIGYIEGNLV